MNHTVARRRLGPPYTTQENVVYSIDARPAGPGSGPDRGTARPGWPAVPPGDPARTDGRVMSAPFTGQPGDPADDPYVDTTGQALFHALDALRAAALFADDPDGGPMVAETLTAAEMVKFGFPASTDEAIGLHLLINVIRRVSAEVSG